MNDEGSGDLEHRIAALYANDPSEFVAAREREVKALRADKRREDAAAAHKLPRPSLVAWAAGRVVAEQPARFEVLLDAGQTLLEAQTAALEQGDAVALRAALAARRRAVSELVEATVAFLARRYGSPTVSRDELAVLFEAVSVDAESAVALGRGVLARTPSPPSGFDLLGEVSLAPSPATRRSPARVRGAAGPAAGPSERIDVESVPRQPSAEAEQAAQAEQRARQALHDAERARQEAIDAEQQAQEDLADAAASSSAAADEVRVLEERLSQARNRATERAAIHERAEQAHRRASETRADAEDDHRRAADAVARRGRATG